MRTGGFIHSRVLIERIDQAFQEAGARTWREAPARDGSRTGYVDLLVHIGTRRISVEAELSAKRVGNDLEKAARLGVNELWIVVPNHRVARPVRRKLERLPVRPDHTDTFVFSLVQALQRVRTCFPLFSGAYAAGKQTNI